MEIEKVKRIGIFRALQLGDILCAMPAIKAIKKHYPEAEIIFIGLPHTKHIIERFNECIDTFIEFPGYPGLPEREFDETAFKQFLSDVQLLNLDMLFQMHGKGSIVYDFLNILGAKQVVGFCETEEEQNENLLKYPDTLHEIDRHLALLKHLDIPCEDPNLFFPLTDEDKAAFEILNLKPKEYICIHPGSRANWRQWPLNYFAAIADYCKEAGYEIVITGSESEIGIVNELVAKMKHTPIILAGKTSLGGVGAVIKNAYGLVANCTGVSHISAALKTPSVIISMDGEPERWKPRNVTLHSTIDWTVNPVYFMVFKAVKNMLKEIDEV